MSECTKLVVCTFHCLNFFFHQMKQCTYNEPLILTPPSLCCLLTKMLTQRLRWSQPEAGSLSFKWATYCRCRRHFSDLFNYYRENPASGRRRWPEPLVKYPWCFAREASWVLKFRGGKVRKFQLLVTNVALMSLYSAGSSYCFWFVNIF